MNTLPRWIDLGKIDYKEAWDLQLLLVEKRRREEIPDLLLFCEHPHVVTVGRRLTGKENILSNRFPVYEVERGGDATYHGPGQLVGYFIVRLMPDELDPHQFLRKIEAALIRVCESCGVSATFKEKYTGVWTKPSAFNHLGKENVATLPRKLASLGISIRQGIVFHGFALNVTTDLSCFSVINPCGLSAQVMTSLENEGGRFQGNPVSIESLLPITAKYIGDALEKTFQAQNAKFVL